MMLRDEIIDICNRRATTVHATVHAALTAQLDALLLSVIMVSADEDTAARAVDNICDMMRSRIREAYRIAHAANEAQHATRQ